MAGNWAGAFLSLVSWCGFSRSFQLTSFCSGGAFCADAKISNSPLLPVIPAGTSLALYNYNVCTAFAMIVEAGHFSRFT